MLGGAPLHFGIPCCPSRTHWNILSNGEFSSSVKTIPPITALTQAGLATDWLRQKQTNREASTELCLKVRVEFDDTRDDRQSEPAHDHTSARCMEGPNQLSWSSAPVPGPVTGPGWLPQVETRTEAFGALSWHVESGLKIININKYSDHNSHTSLHN